MTDETGERAAPDAHHPRGQTDARADREIWIGLDTGGTFTDAVALIAGRTIVASAKALTTHWDLSAGIGEAIRALLAKLPEGMRRERISLVSVSTTLATNAVVESRFSPICTLLIGFDEQMLERSGLRRAGGVLVRVAGGHEATGEETTPLDEAAIDAAVRQHAPQVEAFAVAAMFSVRNPAHERRARERIRALCGKSVTCSHELSSQLDAPKRALTAALNARLTPQIRHLLEALGQVLEREGVVAPVMVVRGDGTLIRAEVALEYPVETVLSGPAASVVGAGFLTELADFAVADMGGTTTDVAIVAAGRPVVRPEGAVVGGWRTMVEAIDVRTCGLGGDSEVYFDHEAQLRVGPRRAQPLSLLAVQFPEVLGALRKLAASERLPPYAARFALRNPGRDPGPGLDRIERRVWEALDSSPRPLAEAARTAVGVEALRRLVDRGLATLAAFTPSDALHVLARQRDWNVEAARLGATVLAMEERNARARAQSEAPEEFAERIYQHVVREAARVVLEAALSHDPGLEASHGRWGALGPLLDSIVAGKPFSQLLDAGIRLAAPLVAIGAPAHAYYPEVARRLGARLVVPQHAAVCNAVGAVAGVVSESCEILVNQPQLNLFRVHDPAGNCDYTVVSEALEHARRVSCERALAAARRAGASDPHLETSVTERRARAGSNSEVDYLAEAVVRSRATGRPASGRAP
ncbi:MAG TPA: hydantoinase/oxoprolinase family protein [Steroidobacteraceae bacterium]|nr:hydantoinase/oxoprolinase family protein [Steroidobacteraceae bacterium]